MIKYSFSGHVDYLHIVLRLTSQPSLNAESRPLVWGQRVASLAKNFQNPTISLPTLSQRLPTYEIMSEPKMDENTDGSAFDNFFESLGEKTEHLMHKDLAVESKPSININNSKEPTTQTISTDTGNDQRVVDEIESLCMNCHENVC